MRQYRRLLVVYAALFLCTSRLIAKEAPYIAPAEFDFKALLGDPPADDSQQHRDEVQTILDWQAKRSPDDVKRCKDEEEVTVFNFADVLGPWFNEKDLPETAALMKDVQKQSKAISNGAKHQWNRVRPPLADSRIQPCVALENSPSYPSGHATRGITWATLLVEIFPDRKDALMARGKLIGDDRFISGMHYPSDVTAGQELGAEIARRLLANDAFRARLTKAKEECQAAAKKAAGSAAK